ncbi:MAG TPA: sn-glycerol-3-phosphate ABC transporter ATP-binding protein UgpC [Oculatellaceae cyanobacterium]|jgi:multiple sugar transport system ATP-binding protein
MANVILENVSKSYDKTTVIQNLSLDIQDKEFIVLVGPSGCGKSTVLRMIAGLESITSGTIKIGDRVVNDVAPKDRDIAMVFQNYALYPHMSVYDNMAFGLKMRKTPKAEIDQKVREAARILDLEHLLNRKPKQLSGGQRQRVALGRAIVRNPQVFLMDEPLSNLDAKLRVQMRTEIAALHKRLNATTIYVTHDQVEAMTMGDRIVILNGGKIQQVDTPLKVYHDPANMFVAGFVGQMNFLTGLLQGRTLQLADGSTLPLPSNLKTDLTPLEGRGVVLGLRPEHIVPAQGSESGHPISLTVTRLEMLGSEQMVHFQLNGSQLIARWPSEVSVAEGQQVTIQLLMDKAFLFDGATEERIR